MVFKSSQSLLVLQTSQFLYCPPDLSVLHFVKVCGLGTSEVFASNSTSMPPPSGKAPSPSLTKASPTLTAWHARLEGTKCLLSPLGQAPTLGKLLRRTTGTAAGSFEIENDNRQLLVQNFHRVQDKVNVSMSLNPCDFVCLTCPEQHATVKPMVNPPKSASACLIRTSLPCPCWHVQVLCHRPAHGRRKTI